MQRQIVHVMMGLVVLSWLGGCNVIAAATQVVTPPEKVEAKYDLPDQTTLVVVDDPRGLVASPATLRRIASATRNVLETEKIVVAGGFVGQDVLAGYREKLGDNYSQTSLAAMAIDLKAKQVIHVEVVGFRMELGGSIVRPGIALDVKVFDLNQRGRVFPGVDAQGGSEGIAAYPLESQLPARDLTGQGAARNIAVRDLADQAGRDVARLFFDWRRPEPGTQLNRS